MNVLHVGMFAQICVRSIATPPMGPGAPILLPPRAGSLKYTSSAVASICAFNMAFIEDPDAFAALMMFETYVATWEHVAVALRSWNGAYCRNQVPDLQTVPVDAPLVMIAWPFLFCQKPIVSAPVRTGPHTVTVWLFEPVAPVSVVVKVAVLL